MDKASIDTPRMRSTTNLWLLISLFLSLLFLPLLEGLYAGRPLLLLGLSSTFLLGAMAARSSLRILTLVLLFVALPTAWATTFVESKPLFVAHCFLGSAFFWLVGGLVVFIAIGRRSVSLDSVFGAISAYLLFGLAWALSYWAIHTLSPDVFAFAHEQASAEGNGSVGVLGFSLFVYFSFVTMATLGYVDIAPIGRITRALAWMQTVTGQFYVAVVIAWLVSALPRPGIDTG